MSALIHFCQKGVGKLVLEAQFEAGLTRFLANVNEAWQVEEFYMWDFVRPSHYVDINSTLEQKVGFL